jgi:hypothetical protein
MRLRPQALLAVALTLPAIAQQPSVATTAPSASTSTDESTKLIALNAIMNADPDRGMPLLEGILKGAVSSGMKDRAMSVLTQSKSPRAQQVLTDYAKSTADPDLQLRAIRYIGRSGTKDAQLQLAGIYPSASDSRVKQEIIRSLMVSGAGDSLLTIAKSEKDQTLRNDTIRNFATSEGMPTATLTAFYASETDVAAKRLIISGLSNRGDAKTVIELVRKENDPAMKACIVQRLSVMSKNKDAMDFMMELLK